MRPSNTPNFGDTKFTMVKAVLHKVLVGATPHRVHPHLVGGVRFFQALNGEKKHAHVS